MRKNDPDPMTLAVPALAVAGVRVPFGASFIRS
jgi:hypothetical protein